MNSFLRFLPHFVAVVAGMALAACATNRDISGGDTSSQGTMMATTRASGGGRSTPAFETAGDAEGIVRLNGRLLYVKDQGTSVLRGQQRVTKGLYLEKNGDVTLADGRRVRVLEGYMVTTGGEVIKAPSFLR